ncbi:HEAT repeat domain-containing protein [Halanaeroarchaeum sulfurireducens]|uniref:Phycocyanin alpha phycocyanobilin lyase n=1 Tax=Halanaeroarchaeum sulfurireducens TaxID=1604004 RepID=A0A0N9MJA8_9EURY|nr:HEAT repeat domain-containing protein [Halanaeroarchaeum sulfurireducens]ALG82236.1 phycocyanin alpha phycocyanobilin lyase [Halanaeroarchaeum sulfurireducens]
MPSLFGLERDKDVEALRELLATSDNPMVRKRAAEILGNLDETGDEEIETLVAAVQNDEDEAVRAASIDALTQLEAIDALLTALGRNVPEESANWAKAETFVSDLTADAPELRMAAANVLGQIGSENAVRPLMSALDDRDPRVRARAARALGQIGEPTAAGALANRLHGEPLPVRREAADALGHLGGDDALEGLLTIVDADSEELRRTAATSLGRFGDERPIDALVDLLGDESDLVRRSAVFSLIEILSNVDSEKSDDLRQSIVERMSASDDPSIVQSLAEIVEEGTQLHQRRNAVCMLGRVAGEQSKKTAGESLINVLDDEDQLIQQFAATSLAEIGGRSVETALLHTIDEATSTDAIAMAAFTLGKVGSDRAKRRLERLVDDTESEEVRRKAFSAMSKLGGGGQDFGGLDF